MPSVVSIVLPVHNQADHIADIVDRYRQALEQLPGTFEYVLVTNACRDDSPAICAGLASGSGGSIHAIDLELGGWGRAVRAGLAHATGDWLCYTNSARTSPELLASVLGYAGVYPEVVVKAQRTVREHWQRRLGSVLYNLECRVLLDLASWDVNGTPKVFPRSFAGLLELERNDDLIDAEFLAVCRSAKYPLLEVPTVVIERHGGRSTTGIRSALKMYYGAWELHRQTRTSHAEDA
jgi:glycosyltransferase involved in cell wall biosynthesis